MSYYQGDFYQGDPGFFSFLGKAAKAAVGFIPGVGGVASKALGAIGSLSRKPAVKAVTTTIAAHPTLSAAGGAATAGIVAGATGARMGGKMGRATVRAAKLPRVPGMHHHRRMRVTNVKALRRAIRRARGFEKLARKVMHFTSPRKVKGRAIFRVRRRAK